MHLLFHADFDWSVLAALFGQQCIPLCATLCGVLPLPSVFLHAMIGASVPAWGGGIGMCRVCDAVGTIHVYLRVSVCVCDCRPCWDLAVSVVQVQRQGLVGGCPAHEL